MPSRSSTNGISTANLVSHSVLGFFSPLLSLFSLATVATVKTVGYRTVDLTVLIASVAIALLNTTKVPESDLYNYLLFYEQATSVSMDEYLSARDYRDPFFHWLSFIIARVSNANHLIYVFVITFVVFLFFLKAVENIGRSSGLSASIVLILVIAAAFFGPSVSLSGHLLRQMLAGSLVCYFISTLDNTQPSKFNWVYLLLSVLTHISVFLFFPILVARIYQGSKYSKYFNAGALLLFVSFSVFLFSSAGRTVLSDAAFIGVLVARSSSLDGADIQALSLLSLLIIFATFMISVFIVLLKMKGKLTGPLPTIGSTLSLYLISFVLITYLLGGNEISSRYFFFVYMLMLALLPLALVGFKNKRIVALTVLLLSLASFYISVIDGVWQYDGLWLSLVFPIGLLGI
ncbi:EpsG family protein [Pseudohongiella sp. O18]|uniref:EpsG family protein n=1 Tax=Pseudohongiella sp. O18 TaxID=2904248 RepID=UPI001F2DA9F3|nr:EpsG family protein [Pseudohongiella sp. O18]